jgi:tetratricopeptide (TPR) repeat protein
MALKLRSFSQYHPSLAINLILIAKRHLNEQPPRYREALDFYEHALEIQSLNLTDNHPKIKKICYAMGNIYCKLDKLSNAMEKYDVAESKSSNIVEDDILQEDKINSEESMEILKARISMHQHLAEFHERKQAYKEAISEMSEIISLLKEELPPSTFEMSDQIVPIQQNIDKQTLINRLQQLANCYLYLGDVLGFSQEDDNGYGGALDIYLKLFQYDKELTKNKLVLLYKKLSNYYQDLGDNEKALEFLKENVDLEEKPTIATLYRLGFLNVACDELDEAIKNYKNILSDQSVKEDKQLEKIVQEKLNEVQKKAEKQQRSRSSTSSESDENISNNAVSDSLNKLSTNETNISTPSNDENKIDPDANVENAGQSEFIIVYFYLKCLFYVKQLACPTTELRHSLIFNLMTLINQ